MSSPLRPSRAPSLASSRTALLSLCGLALATAAWPPLASAEEALHFRDAFRESLEPGWSWVREDPSGWRLRDGALEIRVRPGNLWGPPNDAGNVLVRELPRGGDSACEVSVSNDPTEQWEQAGLAWYVDDSHMVKLVKEQVDREIWIVMGREERDRTRTIAKIPLTTRAVRLRIETRGDRVVGFYAPLTSDTDEPSEWRRAGECEPPRYEAREDRTPKIALQVYNGPREAEHWARFRGFRTTRLFDDSTLAARIGVNIHFTGAPARDLDLLAEAGFGWVRMDMVWEAIEREKGVYRWRAYDELVEGLSARGIRALFILDYSNRLYESARSVRTPEGRAAFARFAAAAAERYRGRGVRWEIWNEPNHPKFWTPEPSPADYLELVRAAAPAIRAADPAAKVLGPATSGLPHEFIAPLFEGGFLELVDEVSVHPYRSRPPETVLDDYARLEALIARHTAPNATPRPIVSGEWGWSNRHWGKEIGLELQGMYLARQLLVNASAGVPLSIWYDWANDGPDPNETEHHFGTVTLDRQPKPAWHAARTLTAQCGRLRFARRLESSPDDFLLVFAPAAETDGAARASGVVHVLAAWTVADPHEVRLSTPDLDAPVEIIAFDGRALGELAPVKGTLAVELGPGPRYLRLPTATAEALEIAAGD